MKKFYLGALGCLLAMGLSAQKIEQVGTMQGEIWSLQSIPTEYAYEGKSSVYTINETETDVEFTVYNKSFAVDRTIKVANPTSYNRTVVESREAVMMPNGEGSLECGYRTLDEFYDGSAYYDGTKSYPHWWAVNKCANTTYTDEYVDEYIEIGGYCELVEKKEYDGGTLFVTDRSYSYETYCYYFKNNKLYACYYDTESGVLTFDEEDDEIDEYYDFYNTQLAVFSQEDITEYINQGKWFAIPTESGKIYFSDYQVTSTETEADGSVVFLTNTYNETTGLKFIWNKESNPLAELI